MTSYKVGRHKLIHVHTEQRSEKSKETHEMDAQNLNYWTGVRSDSNDAKLGVELDSRTFLLS